MAKMAAVRLLTAQGLEPQTVLYRAEFPAPMLRAESTCRAAQLLTGDGRRIDVEGGLCSPGETTWREQRTVVLPPHRYEGTGPYQARLRWGSAVAESLPESPPPSDLPKVLRFAVTASPEDPLARTVTIEVAGLAAGQHLRLDAGAGLVHYLSAEDLASGAVERVLAYGKPGPYRVTLDLLDAEHFLLAALAEQEEEVAFPAEIMAGAPAEPLAGEEPAAARAAAAEPWLPYRYLRPSWSGVRTYVHPGGGAVSRVIDTWTLLSVRAETAVGNERWFQTALGDWVAAAHVSFMQPSLLRGVAIDSPAPPQPPTPPPPGERRGVVIASLLNVRGRPGVSTDNPPLDQLAYGTPVTIYAEQSVAGAAWYRIGDNRWVHGAYIRIVDAVEPPAPPPAPPAGARRGVVTATALNVRARPGVAADNPPIDLLRNGAEVTIYEEGSAAGAVWYRIGENRWVHSAYVRVLAADAVRAALVPAAAAPTALPLGWVVPASVSVYLRPGNALLNPAIGTLEHNTAVPVLEEKMVSGVRWYRIAEGQWVDGRGVGVARAIARRSGIGSTERWVSVNLTEQTLVAYEGDRPVYAALVATGVAGTPTVQGLFRTWLRLPTGRMVGPGYYLEDVTWTCYFYSGYSLHTAYWHDAFGKPRSHGCVNMSPYDAWWVYHWSAAGGSNSPTVYVYRV